MPGAQSQGRAASMQPLGTIKNKKGHHLNTPPLWETSRAQHCQAGRYSWAMENMTVQELLAAYTAGERNFSGADLSGVDLSGADLKGANLDGANLKGAIGVQLANMPGYSLCFQGQYLSHANGKVSTESKVGGGEVFLLEKLSNGRVYLACGGGERGQCLSHANFGLGLTGNRGEGEEWICHDHGNGVFAFEACGRESGKFLGIDFATVRLANSFRDNGHLWQLKQV
jgi:uncharacterized protein YjbI with pentapeptide repeats